MEKEIRTGWSWTRDDIGYTPMTAEVMPGGSIRVVEVGPDSRTAPGNIHHHSVLCTSPDEVLAKLEKVHLDRVARTRRDLERGESDLRAVQDRRKALVENES